MTIKNADKAMILLMPFIIMDVAYEYYRRDIKPLELRQLTKKYRKEWKEAYDRFNHYFFDALDADMQDAFCDKMDSFKRFMYLDIVKLQSKMIRCLPDGISAQEKQVVAAALLSNRIARIAQDMWGACYQVNGTMPSQHSGLNGILTYTKAFAKEYVKGKQAYKEYCPAETEKELYKGISDFTAACFKFVDYDIKTA
ncbi:MAG: hypothetical protein KBS70_04025 [Bacteroidales bacterium]|nr:hypothetical protein [Candidatus Colicola equi]